MTDDRKREVVAQFTDDVLSKLTGAFFDACKLERWTKRDLSKISGINETAIGHIFAGRRKNLTMETIALLARSMRVRPELILHDTRPHGNQHSPPKSAVLMGFSVNTSMQEKATASALQLATSQSSEKLQNSPSSAANFAIKKSRQSVLAMKLVSVDQARTTWLFPVEEILPLAGANGPRIVAEITSRYNFSQPPLNPTREDIEKNGLKFAAGSVTLGKQRLNIPELIVFTDGIVASSTSTEGAEDFLSDLYGFLRAEHGFREISTRVKRVYVSTLVVEFRRSISSAVSGFEQLSKSIANALNEVDGTNYPIELFRLDFALNKDPEFRPPSIPRFAIELRANSPFSQHRYYSTAPISTKIHLSVLEAFEQQIGAK